MQAGAPGYGVPPAQGHTATATTRAARSACDLDAAARRKAKAPSINHVEPKLSHALGAIPKRCTEPYPAWRTHQRECRFGCERDEKLVQSAVTAYELFFNTYSDLGGHFLTGAGWVEAALRHKRLLLNVPPRHAKTTLMSKWFVIWQLACDREHPGHHHLQDDGLG